MFTDVVGGDTDEITAVVARFAQDQRPDKIDLGIGIYKGRDGEQHLMSSVAQVQQRIATQAEPKGYLSIRGHQGFLDCMEHLVFKSSVPSHLASIQSVGGTGAIRLAFELVRTANPSVTIHVGQPSWSNHVGIARAVGLNCQLHNYYSVANRKLCVDEIFTAAKSTRSGDVFVFHGPCHNPSGVDLSVDERVALLDILTSNGAVPLFDVAYYGLGEGLSADLAMIRDQIAAVPNAMLAMSCSKAFGLYRDRVGTLLVKTDSKQASRAVGSTLEGLARVLSSSAPAHGAEIVHGILADTKLTEEWAAQLDDMRLRIDEARVLFAKSISGLDSVSSELRNEKGLFTLLDLDKKVVETLAIRFAVFLPASGRINLTSLHHGNIERFIGALKSTVASSEALHL